MGKVEDVVEPVPVVVVGVVSKRVACRFFVDRERHHVVAPLVDSVGEGRLESPGELLSGFETFVEEDIRWLGAGRRPPVASLLDVLLGDDVEVQLELRRGVR
jgi:hypothetical protein